MRRSPVGVRNLGMAWGVIALLLVCTPAVVAQPEAAKEAGEATPLAGYAPREKLRLYVEFSGLDAHAEAWHKTAAYKLLNSTTLGSLLEDLAAQVFDRLLAARPDRRVTGAELVKLAEHVGRAGFVLAAAGGPDDAKAQCAVLVLRGAAGKNIRAISSRWVLTRGGAAAKPELAKRGGRSVVLMNGAQPGRKWAWWAERDDLVMALDRPESVDVVAEVLDGKRPGAVEHPIRTELVQAADGLTPVGIAFVDTASFPKMAATDFFQKLDLRGVSRLDYRWGFSDDALLSVLRVRAKRPRQGLLALADQPTFEPSALPMMHEGIEGFTITSMKPAQVLETMLSLAKKIGPQASGPIERAIETFRTKSRLQLQKDVLPHFGPKVTFYTLPGPPMVGTAARAPSAGGAGVVDQQPGAEGEEAAKAQPHPLITALTTTPIPKFVMIVDIDNEQAVTRVLDALVIVANQQLRAAFRHEGGDAGGGAGRRRGAARNADDGEEPPPPAPVPEIRMTPGTSRSYFLSIPRELGRVPTGLRPTLRVASKRMVLASSPDLARQALELKEGAGWTPTDAQSKALEKLPKGLVYLSLDDSSERMAKSLSELPGRLQAALNQLLAGMLPPPAAPPSGDAAQPGQPGQPDPAGIPAQPGFGAPGEPEQGQGQAQANAAVIQFRINPAKVPQASALQPLLFPGTTVVVVDDEEIRYEQRIAFPDLVGSIDARSMPGLGPMLRQAGAAAAAKQGGRMAAPRGAVTPAAPKSDAAPGGEAPRARGRNGR